MTVESCQNACLSQGYEFAGVEYSAECWCDSQLRNGGLAPDGEAQCTMPCNGDPDQMCGGPDRLNLYQYISAISTGVATSTTSAQTSETETVVTNSPSPTTTTTTLPDITTPSSTMTTGSVQALPTGWDYAGCYVDNLDGRIMANQQPDSTSLTPNYCAAICADLGYVVAGMEFATQCFCDNFVRNEAPLTDDADCSMGCSGNPDEKCGGPDRMSVYSKGDLIVLPYPAPQTGGLPGSWEYQGCLE